VLPITQMLFETLPSYYLVRVIYCIKPTSSMSIYYNYPPLHRIVFETLPSYYLVSLWVLCLYLYTLYVFYVFYVYVSSRPNPPTTWYDVCIICYVIVMLLY
jgi:hypothetical protein